MPGGGSLNPSSAETVEKKMHYVHQQGQAVFKFAVRKMEELSRTLLERNNLTGDELSCFIAHQANIRIINAACDVLHIPREKVFNNLEKYGNTSAGSIPLALDEAMSEGRLKPGQLALLSGFGAGLTWGTALVRW